MNQIGELKQENDVLKLEVERLNTNLKRKNQTIEDLHMQINAFTKIGGSDFGECIIKKEAI